jgi:hypothetical protein
VTRRAICLLGCIGALCAASLLDTPAAPAYQYCSPVVTNAGPGFSKAAVLIVSGRTDCEKSRKVIFRALSAKHYDKRKVLGWTCESTKRADGAYGALCRKSAGESLVIKSTTPHRCPGCHGTRD